MENINAKITRSELMELLVINMVMNDLENIEIIHGMINDPNGFWYKKLGILLNRENIIEILKTLHQKGYIDYYEQTPDERMGVVLTKSTIPLSIVSDIDECWFGPTEKGKETWKILDLIYPDNELAK